MSKKASAKDSMQKSFGQMYYEDGLRWGLEDISDELLRATITNGYLRALRNTLRWLLLGRFQTLPEALQQQIEATTDRDKLAVAVRQALEIDELQELQM